MKLSRPVEFLWVARASEQQARLVKSAPQSVKAKNPSLALAAKDMREAGLFALALSDIRQALEHFRQSLFYLRWSMTVTSDPEGEPVVIALPGTGEKVNYERRVEQLTADTWLTYLAMAVMLEDPETFEVVMNFTAFRERGFGYEQSQVAMYKALFSTDPDTSRLLRFALEATDPEGDSPELREIKLERVVPHYALVAAILAGDNQRFEEAVVGAHEAHVRWHSHVAESGSARAGSTTVLIDWVASALIIQAMRSGFDAPSKSPYNYYLADWL